MPETAYAVSVHKMERMQKKWILVVLILLALAMAALNSYDVEAFYTGVIDGYIFNSTNNLFVGADVKVEISSCTGELCNKTDVSDAGGYYGVVNLECNAGRTITVTANGSGGWQGSNTGTCTGPNNNHKINVTMCKAPDPPALNAQPDTHNTTVNLTWTSDPSATKDIYQFGIDGGSMSNIDPATSPRIESGLSYYTNYKWKIRSCSGACCSNWAEDVFNVYNNLPGLPNLTYQGNTTSTNVTLSWESNMTRGQLYDPDGDLVYDEFYFDSQPINSTATPSQTILNLAYGLHTWNVRSCDNTTASPHCTSWVSSSFYMNNHAPAVPVLTGQDDTIYTEVNLSWTSNKTRSQDDEDGDTVHDEIYVRTGLGGCSGGALVYSDLSASPVKKVSGLTIGQSYSWCIKSCDNKGACNEAYDTFSVANNPPPTPLLTDQFHTSSTTLSFQWINYSDPELDPTYNEFQLSTSQTFASFINNATNVTSGYTYGTLSTFTFYYWRVRTCDNKGACSGWDNDTFFVYECPTCPGCGTCPSCSCPPAGECPTCEVCEEPEECFSSWDCGDWSACNEEGTSFRSCSDTNDCIDMDKVPNLLQSCEFIPVICPPANITVIEKEKIVEKPVVVKEIEKLFKKEEVNVSTSITGDNIKVSDVASCDATWLKRIKFVAERDFKIPSGTTIVSNPFKVDCINNKSVITVSVADKYANVKALRCKDKESCVEIPFTKLNELNCGIDILKEAYKKEVDLGDLRNVQVRNVGITPSSNSASSGKYDVIFNGTNRNFNVMLQRGTELSPQNPSLRIISAQLEMKFEQLPNDEVSIALDLPYVKQNIDENSIAVYVRNFKGAANEWVYLDSIIDKKTRKIKAKIDSFKDYLSVDNRIVVAAIAPVCIACEGVEFINVYNPIPITKDAVIMIHGLASSPSTYEYLVNDIKITNQPFQVWTYGYPMDEDFQTISRKFANEIEKNIENFDNIYIVSHSLGGLVTQKAVRYAYEQNIQKPGSYKFVSKVRKIILIAVPNKGSPGAEVYQRLFNDVSSQNNAVENLVNTNSPIMQVLLKGESIPRVPGIDYLVIAGTKPKELFTQGLFKEGEKNDGIVSVDSATYVGGDYINNLCNNYWEVATTHTDILKNPVARKIIEQIVAKQIAESVGQDNLVGLTSYYAIDDSQCDRDSTYVFIGEEITKEKQYDETGCACGNGYCGVGENEMNCPGDCAAFFRAENFCIILLFIIMISSVLFSIFLVIAVQRMYSMYAFSNMAIVPMIFIITSMISMITYVIKGCYVLWVYRTLTIVLAILSIAIALVIVIFIIVKNRIKMQLVSMRRKDELGKLEDYVFRSIFRNEEIIKRKLQRVGWKMDDIRDAIIKVSRKKRK